MSKRSGTHMKQRSGSGMHGRDSVRPEKHGRSAGKQGRSAGKQGERSRPRVQKPSMADGKMPEPPQMKGRAPWMRAMQQRGRSDDRSSMMRGGPPWMKDGGRPIGMRNGPPWMRGQMQHAGQRHGENQSQRINEGQHSPREHRRGAGEGDGPGRGGPEGRRSR
ncbi:MAG: hypothetical protein L7W43_11160 [Rubripirellula sp.]|nr:hypothetical protein [Rubripirellula sp.]